jgi:hypothetical protein
MITIQRPSLGGSRGNHVRHHESHRDHRQVNGPLIFAMSVLVPLPAEVGQEGHPDAA